MDYKFNSISDYENFLNVLEQSSKQESVECKAKHKAVLNTNRKLYCIAMSQIRKIAKQISKTDPYGFLKFVKNDSYEEVLIWGLVAVSLTDLDNQIKELDKYKEVADSWGLIDSVCCSMKVLNKSPEKGKYFEYFYNLCFSEKEYVSRLGVITLMTTYLESEYIDKIYKMCEEANNNTYYFQMGIAWLISFGMVKFKDKTYKLLEKRTLPKFTQNKAISKCRDSFRISLEDKEKLTKYRIK